MFQPWDEAEIKQHWFYVILLGNADRIKYILAGPNPIAAQL